MTPEILLMLTTERRARENQHQVYMPQRDEPKRVRPVSAPNSQKEHRSNTELLTNRLLQLVLVFVAHAAIAMLVGFSHLI